ncbi:response regulator transcription factor [Pontiella agarivorans]|nr:response regulator transcription factor [Pontiella agarivorans]
MRNIDAMEKIKILVVEDEAPIQELLQFNLERSKYRVKVVDSGEEGLTTAQQFKPDLILLDIMLPGADGLEVCKKLKADPKTERIPIIMLTALCEEADIVTGLELGADDYITKPFSPRVLLARVKAALRRISASKPAANEELINIHNITVDIGRHKVEVDGKDVTLTFTEFKVLQLLAQQPGRVFTRYQIVDAVHGEDYPVTDRSVDVQIVGLRKKLAAAGKYIETVRGIGYRFKEEE